MKKRYVVGLHILGFIVFSIIHFFQAERILKFIAPGFHNVQMFLGVVISGIALLFIVCLISCLIILKLKKKTSNE